MQTYAGGNRASYESNLGLYSLKNAIDEQTFHIQRTSSYIGSLHSRLMDAITDDDEVRSTITGFGDGALTGLVNRMRASVFKVRMVEAERDIVAPVLTYFEDIFEEQRKIGAGYQHETTRYLSDISDGIARVNGEAGQRKSFYMRFREFMRFPVWNTLKTLGSTMRFFSGTTFKLLFGFWKKRETVEQKILRAILEQTQFMKTGKHGGDGFQGVFSKILRKGLIGLPIRSALRASLGTTSFTLERAKTSQLKSDAGMGVGSLVDRIARRLWKGSLESRGKDGAVEELARRGIIEKGNDKEAPTESIIHSLGPRGIRGMGSAVSLGTSRGFNGLIFEVLELGRMMDARLTGIGEVLVRGFDRFIETLSRGDSASGRNVKKISATDAQTQARNIALINRSIQQELTTKTGTSNNLASGRNVIQLEDFRKREHAQSKLLNELKESRKEDEEYYSDVYRSVGAMVVNSEAFSTAEERRHAKNYGLLKDVATSSKGQEKELRKLNRRALLQTLIGFGNMLTNMAGHVANLGVNIISGISRVILPFVAGGAVRIATKVGGRVGARVISGLGKQLKNFGTHIRVIGGTIRGWTGTILKSVKSSAGSILRGIGGMLARALPYLGRALMWGLRAFPIIGIISAIGYTAYKIFTHPDGLMGVLSDFGEWAKESALGMFNWARHSLSRTGSWVGEKIYDGLKWAWRGLADIGHSIVDMISVGLTGLWASMKYMFMSGWWGVVDTWKWATRGAFDGIAKHFLTDKKLKEIDEERKEDDRKTKLMRIKWIDENFSSISEKKKERAGARERRENDRKLTDFGLEVERLRKDFDRGPNSRRPRNKVSIVGREHVFQRMMVEDYGEKYGPEVLGKMRDTDTYQNSDKFSREMLDTMLHNAIESVRTEREMADNLKELVELNRQLVDIDNQFLKRGPTASGPDVETSSVPYGVRPPRKLSGR